MAKILIIDDDRTISNMIGDMVRELGHEAVSSFTLKEGLMAVGSESCDVVFLDVRLPDGNGLEVLPRIQASPSAPEVIIITGFGDPDGAELAIKNGAWDYIEKTSSIKTITLCLVRALQYREAKWDKKALVVFKRENIIGHSARIASCIELLAQAAANNTSVLITGETGTGKELFALAIHKNSSCASGQFVTVDCAALPATIVENILFGHEKGAFTGADRMREGLIGQADGGTLFLDEVGELPLAVQKSFLRVIETHHYRPLGGKTELKSDFRLLSATNRDLAKMAKSGQFRDDFLFRLRGVTIEAPPLREHPEDIRDLFFHYMTRICEKHAIEPKGFSPEFLEVLNAYEWPGNVRELIHTLERVFTVARNEPTLYPQHLPLEIRIKLAKASIMKIETEIDQKKDDAGLGHMNFQVFRKAMYQEYLQNLMGQSGNNMKEACRISGLSRSHLYALLKDQGFSKPD
jgi:two-component system, NtrC family, response regulator